MLCLSVLFSVTHCAERFDNKREKPRWAGSSIVRGYISSELPGKQEAVQLFRAGPKLGKGGLR